MAGSQVRSGKAAPGAMTSPQRPGMVPDRAEVAGSIGLPVPPVVIKRRPLSEYGSAQAIMDVFGLRSGDEVTPEDFEQAEASNQELRNAYPALQTPVRPAVRASQPAPEIESGEAIGELQPGGATVPPENA